MINSKIIQHIFGSAFIERWNDFPRVIPLVELDKQAHKIIIAYFLAKEEKNINMNMLIDLHIYEFFKRTIITDIRPNVLKAILKTKSKEIAKHTLKEIKNDIIDIDNGAFYEGFKQYFKNPNNKKYKKEKHILKASSYLATKWEFDTIYQSSAFLKDIEKTKIKLDRELYEYLNLKGVKKIISNKKLAKITNYAGRLRFQIRWAQTPRIPKTSVLGHSLIVAFLAYFYSKKAKCCETSKEYNFFTALFHDLPEALTRDIISPVKHGISGLNNIVSDFEIKKLNKHILPSVSKKNKDEFSYILGLRKNKNYKSNVKNSKNQKIIKDEFEDRIFYNNQIKQIDNLENYNKNEYKAISGKALKQCDRLSAYMEVVFSKHFGVSSKDLDAGKENIYSGLNIVGGVDFKKIARLLDENLKILPNIV
jgi:putative hydrolase of HD superfamily